MPTMEKHNLEFEVHSSLKSANYDIVYSDVHRHTRKDTKANDVKKGQI